MIILIIIWCGTILNLEHVSKAKVTFAYVVRGFPTLQSPDNYVEIDIIWFISLLSRPKFGKLQELSAENFVEAVDKEQKQVVIIIHVYENVSIVM